MMTNKDLSRMIYNTAYDMDFDATLPDGNYTGHIVTDEHMEQIQSVIFVCALELISE